MRVMALVAIVCAAVFGMVSEANANDAPAAPLIVKGLVLVVDSGYLVFTTGDAVKLGDVQVPKWVALGRAVRVRIDPVGKVITAIEPDVLPEPAGTIDASALPRDAVAVDPRSARASVGAQTGGASSEAGAVTVKIDVAVPDVTPPDDDIYLSTDRTNFASAELKMNRIDAFDWTISLPLAAGSTLRYEFTRGSPATVERARNGTIVTPRELTAVAGAHATDTVARWADRF